MPDLSVTYTLTTPGGTIVFNDTGYDLFNIVGLEDEYYLTDIKGLDQAPIRAPIDNRPQTHGGLVHDFFQGPRRITFEGALMIRSTRIQNDMRAIRNQMESDLIVALDSLLQDDGTLAWAVDLADDGPDSRSLTVRCEIPIEFTGIELKTFVFGLVAAEPNW